MIRKANCKFDVYDDASELSQRIGIPNSTNKLHQAALPAKYHTNRERRHISVNVELSACNGGILSEHE